MSESLSPELRDLLALHLVDGLGPQRITALIEHFGSAARARQARAHELIQIPGIGEQLSTRIADALPKIDVDTELDHLNRAGVELLVLGQPGYPGLLAPIQAAPLILYCKGNILESDERAVALVGTRHPDAYGKRMAKELAEGLAQAGVVVVSGLARGIDGLAHQGALDGGGRTLAVLAGGLTRIYPPEHRSLADRVIGAGALITESTMLAEPVHWRFPARNRIISALSKVVVIVQAPAESGTLITAEHAAEQGRTVMAVPGPVGERQDGCHRLLREGAILCRSAADILEELDGVSAQATRAKQHDKANTQRQLSYSASTGPPPDLDATQLQVWEFLADGPRAGDEIARQVSLGVSALSSVLLTLEMKRVLRRLPGNRYERY
jgi:DNA processing protein